MVSCPERSRAHLSLVQLASTGYPGANTFPYHGLAADGAI